MKRIVISSILTMAALTATFLAVNSSHSSVTYACTKTTKGTAVNTPDGTLVCDCTAGAKSCACIETVPCPPGGDDAMLEESGY